MSAPPTQEQRLATFYRKLREREARIAANKQAAEDERAAQEAARDALLADHRHPDGTPLGLEDWKPNQHGLTQEERDKRWMAAAVVGMITEMAECPGGQRNNLLNSLAYRLGRLCAYFDIPPEPLALELGKAALKSGLENHEVVKTLRSGLTSGLKNPWVPNEPR